MSRHAIEVDHVTKRYKLGHLGAGDLRETIVNAGRRLAGRAEQADERRELVALNDVSFAVSEGEAIGVVGRNGAGKSTLLKVLARITEPTSGASRTRGRVGSLLEVGTGFHGDLTGRENVYLNGAILGLPRKRISEQLDAIVDFAGVERFLDTPVKRYSSGMYLRLAFAVAAHLDTEILVVDEVLAVGDAEFQQKCLRRMSDVEAEGRAIVFVSHDLNAVAALCERVVWLDKGTVMADGPAAEVLDAYLAAATPTLQDPSRWTVGDVGLRLEHFAVAVESGAGAVIPEGEPVRFSFRLTADHFLEPFQAAITLFDTRGRPVLEDFPPFATRLESGTYEGTMTLPGVLTPGRFEVTFWAGNPYQEFINTDRSIAFEVVGGPTGWHGPGPVVNIRCEFTLDGPNGPIGEVR
ncbi:MAG: polysaccharide ABC transporter ATP-binding protein [Acidimicrobiales bacterium]